MLSWKVVKIHQSRVTHYQFTESSVMRGPAWSVVRRSASYEWKKIFPKHSRAISSGSFVQVNHHPSRQPYHTIHSVLKNCFKKVHLAFWGKSNYPFTNSTSCFKKMLFNKKKFLYQWSMSPMCKKEFLFCCFHFGIIIEITYLL